MDGHFGLITLMIALRCSLDISMRTNCLHGMVTSHASSLSKSALGNPSMNNNVHFL